MSPRVHWPWACMALITYINLIIEIIIIRIIEKLWRLNKILQHFHDIIIILIIKFWKMLWDFVVFVFSLIELNSIQDGSVPWWNCIHESHLLCLLVVLCNFKVTDLTPQNKIQWHIGSYAKERILHLMVLFLNWNNDRRQRDWKIKIQIGIFQNHICAQCSGLKRF